MDQIASLADPEKNLVRPLGISASRSIKDRGNDLRSSRSLRNLVVARSNDATGDIPLAAADVIRTLNGQP